MILQAISRLVTGKDLSRGEMIDLMDEVADGGATPAQVGAFLAALRLKGETVEEITGAALVMRQRAERIQVDREIFVDTCGTGGDGQNTFNISTTAAFVVAGAGVTVAKHGNRSVSSKCGSADVLAALGVDVDAPRERVERCIAEVGVGFLFAPKLHPAFKAVAGIRRELAIRTVFNLLGPLANPAGAPCQVMGVFEPRWVPIIGGVLAALGSTHAFVVHGDGLDEITVTGTTLMAEVSGGSVRTFEIAPEDLGLSRWQAAALLGGDAEANAQITREVLSGARGAPRDAVLANASAALVAAGAAADLREGVRVAALAVDRGSALEKLERLVEVSRA